MAGPLEHELEVERQNKSRLGRLNDSLGEVARGDGWDIGESIMERSDAPIARGIGAGLLEEQRRDRTWKLALLATIGAGILKVVVDVLLG